MHFTYSELKEIHDGLIAHFTKKDSDIEALENSPSADDIVVVMHNNINKKTTVGALVGHDTPLATVATSGNYNDLINKPSIPDVQIQSDWNQTNTEAKDFIKNKPTVTEQVNSDWNVSDSSSKAYIINKPDLSVYNVSYIPFPSTTPADFDAYIAEYSNLTTATTGIGINHTVILEPSTSLLTAYNLTPYITYYIEVMKDLNPSVVNLEFISYWDDSHNTYITPNSFQDDVKLYGKFQDAGTNLIKINSTKGVKVKCRISITTIENNNDYEFLINCECLGNYVTTINN